MTSLEKYEWATREAKGAAQTLVKYLEKLGYIEEGNTSYAVALTDSLPIAYFSVCGFFDEEEVIERLATELSLSASSVGPKSKETLLELLDTEPYCRMEPLQWRNLRMLPLSSEEGKVQLAVANPLDYEGIQGVEFVLGCKVQPIVVAEAEIVAVLDTKLSFSDKDAIDFIVKDVKRPVQLKNVSASTGICETSTVHDDTSAAPVVRLVSKIFSQAIHCNASDLHIMPQKNHLAVKARVDGIMRPLFEIPNELRDSVISRIKLLCGMDLSEKRLPQDGRLRLKAAHGIKDMRISTVPTAYGENLVARILSSSLAGVSFDSLGMDEAMKENFDSVLKQSSRVHLVTGPTGSGKTTTLYASLLQLIDGERNIVTLEDPIEYRIEGITQIQINPKLQLNFAQGLRSILRQDPDVVLVGEVRDEETASISMKVAQTGHIVMSTLHTNSAAAAITRLRDLGLPSYLIASSLGSVMAQRLVRRLCKHCCEPCPKEDYDQYQDAGLDPTVLMVPKGCERCCQTGYNGRVGIFSFLEITEYVREAIRTECGENEIALRARKGGFKTLMEAAKELLHQGKTSVGEVQRVLGPVGTEGEIDLESYEGETENHAAHEEMDECQQVTRRPRVLLVEDDEDTRSVFSMFLEDELFSVDIACEGHEALQKIYNDAPDLIISDVMMPKMSGLQLLQRLKADKRLRNIPVLMLTANDSQEAELDLMTSGADDFVSKTTKPDILSARARRLIQYLE